MHFQAIGERGVEGEPRLSHTNVIDWSPRQEVVGFTLDTEAMTISLPLRRMFDLQERLDESPATTETMVREVLVLAGKLNHAACCCDTAREDGSIVL